MFGWVHNKFTIYLYCLFVDDNFDDILSRTTASKKEVFMSKNDVKLPLLEDGFPVLAMKSISIIFRTRIIKQNKRT